MSRFENKYLNELSYNISNALLMFRKNNKKFLLEDVKSTIETHKAVYAEQYNLKNTLLYNMNNHNDKMFVITLSYVIKQERNEVTSLSYDLYYEKENFTQIKTSKMYIERVDDINFIAHKMLDQSILFLFSLSAEPFNSERYQENITDEINISSCTVGEKIGIRIDNLKLYNEMISNDPLYMYSLKTDMKNKMSLKQIPVDERFKSYINKYKKYKEIVFSVYQTYHMIKNNTALKLRFLEVIESGIDFNLEEKSMLELLFDMNIERNYTISL